MDFPYKIKMIAPLINLLANFPYIIDVKMISKILSFEDEDQWTTQEILVAVTIITTVQKLGLIVESFAISSNFYDSRELKYTILNQNKNFDIFLFNEKQNPDLNEEMIKLASKCKDIEEIKPDESQKNKIDNNLIDDYEFTHKPIKLEKTSFTYSPDTSVSESLQQLSSIPNITYCDGHYNVDVFKKFTDSANSRHKDFNQKIYSYDIDYDFNWENHAYHFLCEIDENVTQLIKEENEFCKNMTFDKLGNLDSKTENFRTAIWNYVQKLFGLQRLDYNYINVNKLLELGKKTFIKNVACYPEKNNLNVIKNVLLSNIDIIHVILLIVCSKQVLQLRFFAKNLLQHKHNSS